MRKIIHIDMDAFFASVEQRDDPSLKGLPVAVGYDGPRGVVATASYEARRFGVRSAMSMAKAKRLCPTLRIVPCRFARYKELSSQIHDIFHQYTDLVEPLSIDEAFLDVTVNHPGIDLACVIAREIKQKIFDSTGLTASAGVSYNKFLAKIASDFRKPNGLTVVHPLKAIDFISGLPIEDFWGVGPKTAERMHRMGIYNGQQLRLQPLGALISAFGKAGRIYHEFANGIDNRPVEPDRVRKSVGCEETFATDLHLKADIVEQLESLSDNLVRRLERAQFDGRTLTLKVKFHDFTQITRSATIDSLIHGAEMIMDLALSLLQGVDYSASRPVRLLGLTVSNPFLPPDNPNRPGRQLTLFDDEGLIM